MQKRLSDIPLNFSEDQLLALHIIMAFIMFGIALSIKLNSFKQIVSNPKAIITGIVSQFILLPFLTFIFIYFTRPIEGLALGLILVASCPGGNISNFFSSLSHGNIVLSVSLTAISSILALLFTPFNFNFWSTLYLGHSINTNIQLDTLKIMKIISLTLIIPMFSGIFFKKKFYNLAIKVAKPIKIISFILLILIILFAFLKNIEIFKAYYHYIIYLVFFHNAIALGGGYLISRLTGNSLKDSRTISIETGIQNSGLGLIIIFGVFQGNKEMAIIMAWWGIWHIVGGIIISLIFSKGKLFTFYTTNQ